MVYLFNDLHLTLPQITLPNIQALNLKLENNSNKGYSYKYYNDIQKIYKNFQLWFNPLKYIHQNLSSNFFRINDKLLMKRIQKSLPIDNTLYGKYGSINTIQFLYMYEHYTFLKKSKSVLYINLDTHNRVSSPNVTAQLYLYELVYKSVSKYMLSLTNVVSDKVTTMKKSSYNEQIINRTYYKNFIKNNSKLDLIILFTNMIVPNKVLNYEVMGSEMNIISLTHALHILKRGGNLIFYLTSFYENISLSILLLLQSCFKKVHIYHPHFYSYSWANWIVCEHYTGIDNTLLQKLIKIAKNVPSIDEKKICKREFNTLIKPSVLSEILETQRFNMSSFYVLGNEMTERIKFYTNPPKFNKKIYETELIQFYRNYLQTIDVSLMYVLKTVPLKLNLKKTLFVNIDTIDVYSLFMKKIGEFTLVNKNANIIASELSKDYGYLYVNTYFNLNFLNFVKKKYTTIYVSMENNDITLENMINLFNYTTEYFVILFYVNNDSNNINTVTCFMKQITDKVKIVNNGFNIVLKKI